jgi:hypothetical protein
VTVPFSIGPGDGRRRRRRGCISVHAKTRRREGAVPAAAAKRTSRAGVGPNPGMEKQGTDTELTKFGKLGDRHLTHEVRISPFRSHDPRPPGFHAKARSRGEARRVPGPSASSKGPPRAGAPPLRAFAAPREPLPRPRPRRFGVARRLRKIRGRTLTHEVGREGTVTVTVPFPGREGTVTVTVPFPGKQPLRPRSNRIIATGLGKFGDSHRDRPLFPVACIVSSQRRDQHAWKGGDSHPNCPLEGKGLPPIGPGAGRRRRRRGCISFTRRREDAKGPCRRRPRSEPPVRARTKSRGQTLNSRNSENQGTDT